MLALPVVWLSWSILLFLMSIMGFIWRASPGRTEPPAAFSDGDLLAVRLVLTFIVVIAISYGILVLVTFSRYGEAMDKAWKRRINSWLKERSGPIMPPPTHNNPGSYPSQHQSYQSPQESAPTSAPSVWPQKSSSPTSNLQKLPSDVDVDVGYVYPSDNTNL